MTVAPELPLNDGRVLRVRMAAGMLVLEIDGEALLRLTRPDAWWLAEALDAVSTASGED